MTVGETVTVVIDVNQGLEDNTSLAIKTCTLSSNGNSVDFIKNGLVPSYFTQMVVPLNSTLNREAKFSWKVFQVGNLATATLSCKIKLISNNIDHCLSGNFQCEENSSCSKTVDGYTCICNEGFEKSSDGSLCTDINECMTGEFQCEENASCANNIGHYSCVCNAGFERSDEEVSCTDIDECLRTCIIRLFLEVSV